MTDEEQRNESAYNILGAMADLVKVLRDEQGNQYKGEWDKHIDDLVPMLMDGVGDICGSLRG